MKSGVFRLIFIFVAMQWLFACAGPTVFGSLSEIDQEKKKSNVPPPPPDLSIAADGTLAYPAVNGRPGVLTPVGQNAAREELNALTQNSETNPIALASSPAADSVKSIAAQRTAQAEAQITAESERLNAENAAQIAELQRRLQEVAEAERKETQCAPDDNTQNSQNEQDC